MSKYHQDKIDYFVVGSSMLVITITEYVYSRVFFAMLAYYWLAKPYNLAKYLFI